MGCHKIMRGSSSPRVFLSFAALGTVLVLAGFAAKFFLKPPSFGKGVGVLSWSAGGGMIVSGGLLWMLRRNASAENTDGIVNDRKEVKTESVNQGSEPETFGLKKAQGYFKSCSSALGIKSTQKAWGKFLTILVKGDPNKTLFAKREIEEAYKQFALQEHGMNVTLSFLGS